MIVILLSLRTLPPWEATAAAGGPLLLHQCFPPEWSAVLAGRHSHQHCCCLPRTLVVGSVMGFAP